MATRGPTDVLVVSRIFVISVMVALLALACNRATEVPDPTPAPSSESPREEVGPVPLLRSTALESPAVIPTAVVGGAANRVAPSGDHTLTSPGPYPGPPGLPGSPSAFSFDNPFRQRLPGQRLGSQAVERREIPGGGSAELLRADGVSGRVVTVNIILDSPALSKHSLEGSRVKIFVDRHADPVLDLAVVDFFYTRGLPPGHGDPSGWQADLLGVSGYLLQPEGSPPTGRIGFYRLVDIPFQESILIELHNGDAAEPVYAFGQVEFLSGQMDPVPGPQFKFRTAAIEGLALPPDRPLELLEVEGAGFVDSVYLSVWADVGRSFHWAEMNVIGKFGDEDAPAFNTSGTEDFFLSSWGWSAGPFVQRFHGHPVHRKNGWNTQYRYFPSGLWFQDGLTLTWAMGPTDAPRGGGGAAPVRVWWVITYYTLEGG